MGQKTIKVDKMNIYEPYSFKDVVLLDCPECGKEYEWLQPFTVSAMDGSEEYDVTKKCRMHPCAPQKRCINCQVEKRLKEAKEKHDNRT